MWSNGVVSWTGCTEEASFFAACEPKCRLLRASRGDKCSVWSASVGEPALITHCSIVFRSNYVQGFAVWKTWSIIMQLKWACFVSWLNKVKHSSFDQHLEAAWAFIWLFFFLILAGLFHIAVHARHILFAVHVFIYCLMFHTLWCEVSTHELNTCFKTDLVERTKH